VFYWGRIVEDMSYEPEPPVRTLWAFISYVIFPKMDVGEKVYFNM
jgi:hypothetical protein